MKFWERGKGKKTIFYEIYTMPTPSFKTLQASSYLSGSNAEYIEELYEQFLKNPASVGDEWRDYFQSLPRVYGGDGEVSHADIRQYFAELVVSQPGAKIS